MMSFDFLILNAALSRQKLVNIISPFTIYGVKKSLNGKKWIVLTTYKKYNTKRLIFNSEKIFGSAYNNINLCIGVMLSDKNHGAK